MSRMVLFVSFLLLLASGPVLAEDAPKTERAKDASEQDKKKKEDPSLGMSILGNQEAPKALVIVPWKSSEMGGMVGVSPMLDDSRQPIDKEVFMRVLNYYEIRSETTRHDGAPAATRPATAAHRRKS